MIAFFAEKLCNIKMQGILKRKIAELRQFLVSTLDSRDYLCRCSSSRPIRACFEQTHLQTNCILQAFAPQTRQEQLQEPVLGVPVLSRTWEALSAIFPRERKRVLTLMVTISAVLPPENPPKSAQNTTPGRPPCRGTQPVRIPVNNGLTGLTPPGRSGKRAISPRRTATTTPSPQQPHRGPQRGPQRRLRPPAAPSPRTGSAATARRCTSATPTRSPGSRSQPGQAPRRPWMCSRLVKLLTCIIHFRSQSLLPKKVAFILRNVQVASWRRRTSRPTPQIIPAPTAPTTHRGRPRSHQSRPSLRMKYPTDVPLMLLSLLNPTSLILSSTPKRLQE